MAKGGRRWFNRIPGNTGRGGLRARLFLLFFDKFYNGSVNGQAGRTGPKT